MDSTRFNVKVQLVCKSTIATEQRYIDVYSTIRACLLISTDSRPTELGCWDWEGTHPSYAAVYLFISLSPVFINQLCLEFGGYVLE